MSLFKKLGKIVGGVVTGNPGAVISGLAGVAGSVIAGKKAKKAAGVQEQSQQSAIDAQRAAFGTVQGYQQPYLDAGSPAINALMKVNSGDYSGFNTSPDYVYARDQALQGVEGSAAARGGLYSGNNMRRLAEVSSGLASQNLGNYRNALIQQIGIGQSAANNLSSASLGVAGNVGNALIGAGDARASGIAAGANATGNAINQVAGAAGDYFANKLIKKPKPVSTALSYDNIFNKRPNYNSLV